MFLNLLFLFTILITIVSFAFVDTDAYQSCSLAAQICVVVLFVCAIFKHLVKQYKLPGILKLWWWSTVIAFIGLFTVYTGGRDIILNDIRELFIPFVITYSSYFLLDINDKYFRNAFTLIAIVSIIVIIYSLNNTGGFVIQEYYREEIPKNQTSPCIAQIGIVGLILCIKERAILLRLIYLCVFVLGLVYCIVLQARTAFLCMLVTMLLVIWEQYKAKTFILIPIILLAAICTFGSEISDILTRSIVGHYDANDIDSLSSGRMSRMSVGWNIFVENFFFGLIGDDINTLKQLPIVHMYLLWKLIKYGLIGSIPFLLVYFGVLGRTYRMLRQGWQQHKFTIACVAIAFITSLTEYCAPFGPGTSFILGWCLFGLSLRKKQAFI